MVVNTNLGSLSAQRSLAASGVELKEAMERLSSGKKINTAADDAAGFAIAERMTAQIRGLNMATKNANDGLAMLATVENATNDVTDMLQRIRELAVQAANDSNSTQDRGFLQNEVNSLVMEINRVSTQTKYNNKVVLDGTLSGQFQVGTEKDQTIAFEITSIDSNELGLQTGTTIVSDNVDYDDNTDGFQGAYTVDISDSNALSTGSAGTISILTAADATNSLATISAAIEKVASNRASYGALQNRLEYTVSNLMNVAEFTTSARSRIEDADFAAESAKLAKAQVLQQTGTAMLAQANAAPQLALQLIR
jgi:flagellin